MNGREIVLLGARARRMAKALEIIAEEAKSIDAALKSYGRWGIGVTTRVSARADDLARQAHNMADMLETPR